MVGHGDLATCRKIGFIVPSSNHIVEPVTTAIFHTLNETTNANILPIFTRIRVQTLGTDPKATSQFSPENMIAAAQLLGDAEVDAILWNGTSGMWVGTDLDADRKLAKTMQDAVGVPCSTTTIAAVEALEQLQVKRVSLAVPYTEALTQKLVDFYKGCGYEVVGTVSMKKTPATNLEIGKSSMTEIRKVVQEASAMKGAQAVVVGCTNWAGSSLAAELEEHPDAPIIVDSVTVTAWWALKMVGHTGKVEGWGRLVSEVL